MSNQIDSLVMRCATCKHWQGDKEKAAAMFEQNPLSMDLSNGWPNDGACGIRHTFMNTEIHGDATVESYFDANFGCIHWRT